MRGAGYGISSNPEYQGLRMVRSMPAGFPGGVQNWAPSGPDYGPEWGPMWAMTEWAWYWGYAIMHIPIIPYAVHAMEAYGVHHRP